MAISTHYHDLTLNLADNLLKPELEEQADRRYRRIGPCCTIISAVVIAAGAFFVMNPLSILRKDLTSVGVVLVVGGLAGCGCSLALFRANQNE